MILFLITSCLHAKWGQHSKTSLGGVQYEVTVGADDYVVKPFSPAELVARVRSHIRMHERLLEQSRESRSQSIIIKDWEIVPEERRVYRNQEEIPLTNKEFELLLFLAENPNKVFSKEVLFDRIWDMEAMGTTATVTVHINRLRDKLEHNPSNPQIIETVWGAGYRLRVD